MTLQARLKDAILAGLVAGVLALPLLGFETVDTGGPLGIKTRWHLVGYAAAGVFLGRLLLMALLDWRRGKVQAQATIQPGKRDRMAELGRKADTWLMPALIAFAVILPMMPFADRTVVDLGTVVLIYVMLGWGLNIVVGLAGLLDLGYVAFYAVGAYSYALLSKNFGLNFWECLPLAGLFAALFGVALGFPVLRLRGDYLAIVTLGFGEIIRIVLLNWQKLTGGPNGISGIQRPSFFGYPFSANPPEGTTSFHQLFGLEFASTHRIVFLYYLILALALLTNLFTQRIRKLPVGRAWEALREDEIACRALGINPTNTKLTAFAIGAMFGGFAGSFFATRQGFISPESFTFIESAVILAIVVLGGMGSQAGIVLAAAFLTLLPELAREFSLFRMLAFGLAMVLIMVWRPQGLLAHREPTMRLAKAGGGGP
ncbi:high-affinity branched-chain amino acid ABC transporter permease LivM [Ferrovibrio sp.]|uniref:high-affinity branched-chain amino acid ABC transporter permease LivM n=1 Tax=Ferrovibrio sp. TaxID=1917215 RepID=UPI003D272205